MFTATPQQEKTMRLNITGVHADASVRSIEVDVEGTKLETVNLIAMEWARQAPMRAQLIRVFAATSEPTVGWPREFVVGGSKLREVTDVKFK
jgi:hypothetical protein